MEHRHRSLWPVASISFYLLLSLANNVALGTVDRASEAPAAHSVTFTEFDDANKPFVCCQERRVWTSGVLSFPTSCEYLLSANIECVGIGEFEQSDYVTISYRCDAGDWTPIMTLCEDFERSAFSSSMIPVGKSVELKVVAQTSASNEIYKVHRLSVRPAQKSRPPSFPPDQSIDPEAGMQTQRGALIIDGGKMRRQPDQATVKRFIDLTGGLDQPIVVSPTASSRVTDAEWAEYTHAWKTVIGFTNMSFMHPADQEAGSESQATGLCGKRGVELIRRTAP